MQEVHLKLNPGLPRQKKTAFNKKKTIFSSKFDSNLRKNLDRCCIWSTAFYDVETWIPGKVDRKYLQGFKIWCWIRMEKIIWTDRVRNEVLERVKGETDILCTIKKSKPNRTGHILRKNGFIKHVMEGMIEEKTEGTGRRGRRPKQLLDDPIKY
jgi:hypothetical protein